MKLFQVLEKLTPDYVGINFGVECEVEGVGLPDIIGSRAWRVEEDGSLRNGLEYVLRGALPMEHTIKALMTLFATFKKQGSQLQYSFRTSTHVHVNVQDLEVKQIINIIFLYTLVEDLFMNYCDEHRRGNRFCLGFKEAEGLANKFCKIVRDVYQHQDEHAFMSLDQNSTKYAALNLYTLKKYGTLEFRSLEGTNNLDKIVLWLGAISNLVAVGSSFNSIEELHNAFFNDPEAIVDQVFTDSVFKFPGWQRSIEESYSTSYQVVLAAQGVF